jgi:dTDP-4-amino-4,6-dideoxygalactose transaminase
LEREVEKRFGIKHAVACSSGTGALQAAIAATLAKRGITSGEIIVSPYTFSASAAAILHAGYTPVFADVDPHTFCITPETVQAVLTKRTVAVVPVSIFGGMADVEGIKKLGFPVIEDAAQAVGARNKKGYSGALADAAMYSMNGGKNVPGGELGIAVTQNDEIANRMRLVMNHGENFGSYEVGYNFRPPEPIACIGYHGLIELEKRNTRRQELAADFYHAIRYYKDEPRIVRKDHVYYVTPLVVHKMKREELIFKAKRVGVTLGAGYIQPPIYFYNAFKKYMRRQLYTVNELSVSSLSLIYDFTPDKHRSYGKEVGMKIRKILYGNYGPV